MTDTGVGIAPEDQERVFEPFFTSKEGGTGLGLAISREIVVGHGGSLVCESNLGNGATFRLTLPAAEEGPAAMSTDQTRLRVLVVDDDQAIREALSRTLEKLGIRRGAGQ